MSSERALLTAIEREVRACRGLALRYFRSSRLQVARKADRSPVTAADRAIEARLRQALRRLAPGEAILGEEGGRSGPPGRSYWTIDPIDGTRAFSRGLPSWGIMVGRVDRGIARLGVVDFPAVDATIAVAPGVRAFERASTSSRPLPKAKPAPALHDAVLFHGGLRWWKPTPFARGFAKLVQACYLERAYGDCYGYWWVLRGAADAVLDYGVKPWDLVPFAALAASTGHALTDFSGRPSFSGPDTIMAHPAFVKTIVGYLRRAR